MPTEGKRSHVVILMDAEVNDVAIPSVNSLLPSLRDGGKDSEIDTGKKDI